MRKKLVDLLAKSYNAGRAASSIDYLLTVGRDLKLWSPEADQRAYDAIYDLDQ